MSESTERFTEADFSRLDWQGALEQATSNECSAFSRVYLQLANEHASSGDSSGREAYLLLAQCTAWRLRSENETEPFDALISVRRGAGLFVGDLSDQDLEVISTLASQAQDAELQARLADILWVRKRDHRMARIAVAAYISSAERLESGGDWLDARDRLERALRLGAFLGKAGVQLRNDVVASVERALRSHDCHIRERLLQPARLMALLIEFRLGDTEKWLALAEELANLGEQQRDWERGQDYWDKAAGWARIRGDAIKQRSAQIASARLFERIADDFIRRPNPDHLSGSIQLARGFEAMRQLGETGEVDRLHRRLLQHQELSMDQMKTHSQSVDISRFVKQAMDAVDGKPFISALLSLALLHPSPSVEDLRETADRQGKELGLGFLFTSQRVDSRGRVVATPPTRVLSDAQSAENEQLAEMFDLAGRHQELIAEALIEPGRSMITLQHQGRVDDFLPLLLNNPFVAPGRELIVAKGLQAGLYGDFIVACHLLIPQLEEAIRGLLNRAGVITSTMLQSGVQEELELGRLLAQPELQRILGEDLVFDLKGLLVERDGTNLRNRMAHGLIGTNEFFSPRTSYLWWLCLRLCCLPILAQIRQHHEEASQEGPNNIAQ